MSELKKKSTNLLITWFFFGFISGPFGIIIHEVGHYAAARLVGYENSKVRYASMNRGDSPDEIELDWKRGIISSGGPIVTMLVSALCCIYVLRKGHLRIVRTIGFSFPLRNISSIIAMILILLEEEIKGNDEANIASFFDISPFIPLLLSALVLIITWSFLIGTMEKKNRWKIILSIFLGIALGNIFWLQAAGPILLP